jgi:hypothetical protein
LACAAKSGVFELVVSGHSIAEIYSVLTALPRIPRISPQEAVQLLQENIVATAQLVTLAGSDYVSLVEQVSQRNIIGGTVYDGVIAKAAELAQVDLLVTLNEAHFRQVWPSAGSRIVSPLSTSPPI